MRGLLEDLAALDPERMTPIEALQHLARLRQAAARAADVLKEVDL
jgi:hypothetical protein